jgi:anthranilate 1,2-dioxygenase small subunit/terephthalate 1,2-dioxygenase oxygenase component beta subunit
MSDADTLFRLSGLNAAYAAAIDSDRLEDWPDFFTERCLYKVTSADNHAKGYAAGIIFADSQAMLRDRVSSLRVANIYERQRYRHIVGMPVLGAAFGTSETSFVIVRTMRDGRMDLFAAGIYLDKTVTEPDGTLRFAERVVVCDSGRFDTLVAIPL